MWEIISMILAGREVHTEVALSVSWKVWSCLYTRSPAQSMGGACLSIWRQADGKHLTGSDLTCLTLGTCTTKMKGLIPNACGMPIHATWEYFPVQKLPSPRLPFSSERCRAEAYTMFTLNSGVTGWYTPVWTQAHALMDLHHRCTRNPGPGTSGFVSILSKTWLGSLSYTNSFSS